MVLLGKVILFGLWGLLSLLVLPAISQLRTNWEIVFGGLWIGVLFAALVVFDSQIKKV